ncbi:hypothetical protein J31TS6_07860 [Brevibacillus reuszeri]|uniref:hypothetical protein n=1 Tax=Brevibacillus reuszeri TaxID=54915 RepID=UPI001B1E4266|nr:hypothetical protein [Brevibacillus reuszeri]GIO04758.1 hypothetical protein J31TS6_07860 [Brevibacillus reuszeri]
MDKNRIDLIKAYLGLIAMLIFVLVALSGLINLFWDIKRDFFITTIGFAGAILGGVITLLGVRMTIADNEKHRKREYIPQKILRLENAISHLNEISSEFEHYLAVDAFEKRKQLFFSIDPSYGPSTSKKFKKHTVQDIRFIRDELIFVDSKTYKIFLEFQYKVDNLYNKVFWNAEYALHEFREKLIEYHIKTGTDIISTLWSHLPLNEEQQSEKAEVEKQYNKLERQYIYFLGELFNDLKLQLECCHIELLEELDY